jgi:uncharacterized membrane protein YfcA
MMAEASDPAGLALLFAASVAAGGVNAIAGGGTILTFAVLSAILPPGPGRLLTANVTSKLGLWPGAAAAAWASRHEWSGLPRWARWLVLPSMAGAVAGVVLLQRLPATTFDAVVPWLILMAAVLFTVQPQGITAARQVGVWSIFRPIRFARKISKREINPIQAPRDSEGTAGHWARPPEIATQSQTARHPQSHGYRRGLLSRFFQKHGPDPLDAPTTGMLAAACGLQFLVGIYGGYFGAGIGILMLAGLAVFRLGDIHAVNAVKNLLAATVNGVATLLIVIAAIRGNFEVFWVHVAVAAIGSVIGGIAVAKLSRRLPATAVRRLVAIIAFALAGYHLWKEFS